MKRKFKVGDLITDSGFFYTLLYPNIYVVKVLNKTEGFVIENIAYDTVSSTNIGGSRHYKLVNDDHIKKFISEHLKNNILNNYREGL